MERRSLSPSTFSSTFILKNRRDNELYLGQASGSLISIHSADGETAVRNPRKITFHILVSRARVIRKSCVVSFPSRKCARSSRSEYTVTEGLPSLKFKEGKHFAKCPNKMDK